MAYTKTLTFKCMGLGGERNIGLMLIFDNPTDGGLYTNGKKFPVVWKVFRFKAIEEVGVATFSSQLVWCKAAINIHGTVIPSACTPVNYDRGTKLQQGAFPFIGSETASVSLVNGTHDDQEVTLGFLPEGANVAVPMYYWKVEASKGIQTNVQPVLRAYITRMYPEGKLVKHEIAEDRPGLQGTTPIHQWTDLSILDDNTTWNLIYDANLEEPKFKIDQVMPAE